MSKIGLIKTASAAPVLKVANTKYNTDQIISCLREADSCGAGITVFPELAVTAYSCADLFFQEHLYQANLDGLKEIVASTENLSSACIVGFYLRIENAFYNCAAFIKNGRILGVIPKMFLPSDREFYETRWFSPGIRISESVKDVRLFGETVPFGNIIFNDEVNDLNIGIEICQDVWMPITPGSLLCLNGAHIICNPSASTETVGKADYRRGLILQQSASNISGYVYTSSGVYESTTDVVYSGHCIISENGIKINENVRFERDNTLTYGEIDFSRLKFERSFFTNLEQCTSVYSNRQNYQHVCIGELRIIDTKTDSLSRHYEKNPFVPSNKFTVDDRCREIFNIQTAGLAKRLLHTNSKKVVVGISGGLDSTLSLLVCAETMKLLGKPADDIIAVTMPGFGTTGKTYNNALSLMKLLGTDFREISIVDSVKQHFTDIGQDIENHDITYENAQARERTQILMDIANKEGGLVVGTGDLSEVALGWSTYNGDHMSMYSVNCSVPKTLIIFVIKWIMENKISGDNEDSAFSQDNVILKETLQKIIDTPISPELLPPDENGEIKQKTEDTVGPYILHDFFLYYTLRFGMRPEKLLYIAAKAFEGDFTRDIIKKWLKTFYRRFFAQQFKRSCTPDGPKVGSVSLSPRGDWRMPTDADASLWLDEVEKL